MNASPTPKPRGRNGGRPKKYGERMVSSGVSMPPSYWQQAEQLGGGDKAAGIRRALDTHREILAQMDAIETEYSSGRLWWGLLRDWLTSGEIETGKEKP